MSTVKYYQINEDAARRAKEMNSFSDYEPGSATEGYKAMVDKAAKIAAEQKARVDPMYHEKIDVIRQIIRRWFRQFIWTCFQIQTV